MADISLLLDKVQTHHAFLARAREDGQAEGYDHIRVRIAVGVYQYRANQHRRRKFVEDGKQLIFNLSGPAAVASVLQVEQLVRQVMEKVASAGIDRVSRAIAAIEETEA